VGDDGRQWAPEVGLKKGQGGQGWVAACRVLCRGHEAAVAPRSTAGSGFRHASSTLERVAEAAISGRWWAPGVGLAKGQD
jgi:hypothetical protein